MTHQMQSTSSTDKAQLYALQLAIAETVHFLLRTGSSVFPLFTAEVLIVLDNFEADNAFPHKKRIKDIAAAVQYGAAYFADHELADMLENDALQLVLQAMS